MHTYIVMNASLFIVIWAFFNDIYIYICMYVYICVYICMYVCIYMYVCIVYIYIYIYIYMYVCMCVCMYIYMYVFVCDIKGKSKFMLYLDLYPCVFLTVSSISVRRTQY